MGNWLIYTFMIILAIFTTVESGGTMRKSIVYNKNTPDVFYCPVHKPTDLGKIIVSAKPLNKLCELKGGPIPEDYKSDCYKDVDESEYACKEKLRIMTRIHPPGSDTPYNGTRILNYLSSKQGVPLNDIE